MQVLVFLCEPAILPGVRGLDQAAVATSLAEFRSRFPGCETVLLADIEAGTVLASNSAIRLPQEHLDALGELATDLLADRGAGRPDDVLRVSPTGIAWILRDSHAPGMALCGVFSVRAGIDGLEEAGRTLLARFADGGAE